MTPCTFTRSSVFFLASLLTGCGAGGSPDAPPQPTAPIAATRIPLPPWLQYCDGAACAALGPVVVTVCPSGPCTPSRSTTIIPSVNGQRITGLVFPIQSSDTLLTLQSGNGRVFAGATLLVEAFTASSVEVQSDESLTLTYYELLPQWNTVTSIDLLGSSWHTPALTLHWYQFPSLLPEVTLSELADVSSHIVAIESTLTGRQPSVTPTLFFLPTELAAAQPSNEGNEFLPPGTLTINYGNPAYLVASGGLQAVITPLIAHETAHALSDTIPAWAPGACWEEGLANATGWVSGFIPTATLGPIGLRGQDFTLGCQGVTEAHDVGDCYVWHLLNAGQLTADVLHGLYHPQHVFTFESCTRTEITGNTLWVYWVEAGVSGAVGVLDAIGLPHAASYAEARIAVGL